MRTGTPITETEVLAVAYLAGQGKKQTEIADMLHISQAAVSRLLVKARKKYLEETVRFVQKDVDDAAMGRILERISRNRLSENLDKLAMRQGLRRGPILRSFPSGSRHTGPDDWQARLTRFSREAANYVKALLLRSSLCGISWGNTLGKMVAALQDLPVPPPCAESDPVLVVPLCGEPFGEKPTSSSSTNLAEALEKFLNGRAVSGLSLSMVPAFIPGGFNKVETNAVWKLIGMVDAHKEIVGGRKRMPNNSDPLVERLDMVLTSVGPEDRPLGYGGSELIRHAGLGLEELRSLIVGDISGVCIGKNDAAEKILSSGVGDRWTGIRREHLETCARRSFAGELFAGPPGVVVVAIGANKAQFVCAAAELGLVNHLVVDDDLAEALDRAVAAKLGAPQSGERGDP